MDHGCPTGLFEKKELPVCLRRKNSSLFDKKELNLEQVYFAKFAGRSHQKRFYLPGR